MSNILHCLQLGESMRDRFLEEARSFPYGSALFLVPNRYFQQKIREKGVIRAATIDFLPQEILRWNGGTPGFRPVNRPAQKKILQKALDYLKPHLDYFSSLVGKTGFRDNLLALFDEFSRDGLEPETFEKVLLSWNRVGALKNKDMDLVRLYTAYCFQLQELGLEDLPRIYTRAAETLEQGGRVPWKKCYFSEFYQFDPVQLRLIRALGQCCSVEVGLFYDPKRPELSQVTEKIYGDLVGAGFNSVQEEPVRSKPADLTALTREWKPGARTETGTPHIHLGEGVSQEQEIRMALTSIKERLQQGVKPEGILVLVRKLTDYQGLVRSFTEYGIPCRLPQVVDLQSQPLPDFLTKLMAAVGEKEDISRWQALFRCPLMEVLYQVDRGKLDFLYTQQYFSTAEDFRSFLQRKELVSTGFWDLVDFLQEDHTSAGWRDGFLDHLAQWKLPQAWGKLHQEGKVDLDQVKLLTQTEQFVRETLEDLVRTWELWGQKEAVLSLKEVRTFWKDSLDRGPLTLTPGDSQGIPVREAGEIQGVSFPYVYLLGVREGMFPAVKRESWLYNDQERAELNSLGLELNLTARALDTDRYFFGSAAALATQDLYLSWYSDEEGGASAYITDLRNFFGADSLPVTVYQNDPDHCASRAQLVDFLAEQPRLEPQEQAFLAEQTGSDFPERSRSEYRRWEETDSPWNGTVPGVVKGPLHLSASALDDWLQCPFAYLASRLWKMAPWQERTAFPTPDIVGDLIHQTLAAFLEKHLQEGLTGIPLEELEKELAKTYETVFAQMHQEGKIDASPLLGHLRQRYGKWLQNWLRKEIAYEESDQLGLKPDQVEWSFGREQSPRPELAKTIDGEKVYFSGQIDRIDTNGQKWILLDYKTGTPPSGQDILQGKAVQLPLYLEALETLGKVAKEQILGAGYVQMHSGDRKGGTWDKGVKDAFPWMAKARPPEKAKALEAADQAVEEAVREIRRGHFPARPEGNCPDWCPARDLCRIRENPYGIADKEKGEE
ncbi:PD-(D/E)XK nuclease family protein [uncultured Acidaminococcus sp.]|uniref:PD-(D/E)XK nuclease family protein n=1 Tax=uncultured Acidaminococcus sp. TaxID=352152 RepID=UPI0026308A0E|nr:PD-(D/E)XK nuclease family protein [uncultured Acidaminococcus sp.]